MGEHVPTFKSRQEEARFWDAIGLEDLSPDEVEEVEIERPSRPLSATFAVRFDPKIVELIRTVARSHGLGPTQLVRAWVMERLKIERAVGSLAEPTSEFPNDFELTMRSKMVEALMQNIPAAAEAAMQEVLDRADQERASLMEP